MGNARNALPKGGYYSSVDADSEGVEGKFYVWELEQLQSLLSDDEFAVVSHRFGLERGPNFEDKYHLHEFTTLYECAEELSLNDTNYDALWQQSRPPEMTKCSPVGTL